MGTGKATPDRSLSRYGGEELMLHPNDRQLLHKMLRPPVNVDDSESLFQLDWAIGTTYSLDLITLLSVPLACTLPTVENRAGKLINDPLALLKSLRECADRICLFCQAGKISVPGRYLPLIQMLEGSIIQAQSPRGGNFHPKVWVLRFTEKENPQRVRYRFLCLTRNLTFDRSWDTLLSLEGDLKDRQTGFSRNRPLVDFVAALPEMALTPLPKIWIDRWNQTINELRKVNFELPVGFDELFFCPIGIPNFKDKVWPFQLEENRIDRLMIVSPFVDDRFFDELGVDRKRIQLVSRPETLANLNQEELSQHSALWILDEAADPEPEETDQAQDTIDDPLESDAESPLRGLHAKLFVAEQGWNSRIWSGSANATSAAFERNVEFLVELVGKRSFCGIDAILGERSEVSSAQSVTGMRDLLIPYVPSSGLAGEDLEKLRFEREVDRLSKLMASRQPVVHCTRSGEAENYALCLTVSRPITENLEYLELRGWPLSLGERQSQLLNLGSLEWAKFQNVSFEGITPFIAVQVSDRKQPELSCRFMTLATLKGAPENRRERLLASMLSDRQRVLRYLLLLLLGDDSEELMQLLRSDSEEQLASDSNTRTLFEGTLLETMLEALAEDPCRIRRVAQVIDELRSSIEGKKVLPDGFEAIWDPIQEYYQTHLGDQPAPAKSLESGEVASNGPAGELS